MLWLRGGARPANRPLLVGSGCYGSGNLCWQARGPGKACWQSAAYPRSGLKCTAVPWRKYANRGAWPTESATASLRQGLGKRPPERPCDWKCDTCREVSGRESWWRERPRSLRAGQAGAKSRAAQLGAVVRCQLRSGGQAHGSARPRSCAAAPGRHSMEVWMRRWPAAWARTAQRRASAARGECG